MNVNERTLQDFGSEISLGGVLLPPSLRMILQHCNSAAPLHRQVFEAFSSLFEPFFRQHQAFRFMILQCCKTVTLATEPPAMARGCGRFENVCTVFRYYR